MGFMDQVNITGPVISLVVNIPVAIVGDNIIIPNVPGKKLEVYRLMLTITGADTIVFKDGAAISLTGAMDFGALANIFLDPTTLPWFEVSAGNDFIINSTAATKIAGKVDYIVQR